MGFSFSQRRTQMMTTRNICIMEYVVVIIRLSFQKYVLTAERPNRMSSHGFTHCRMFSKIVHTAECLQNIFLAAVNSHKIDLTQNVLLAL